MATAQERQAEIEEQRGYGAAKDDVNEETPDQAQQRHGTDETDKTSGGLAEQAQAEESGRGREAS
jgi:hypothetical protein